MQAEEIAVKFFTAYPIGDIRTLRELFHPDATVWHNWDGSAQPIEENFDLLKALVQQHTLAYQDIRRHFFEGGFVQQHVVHVDAATEHAWTVEACIVFHLSDGRVRRLEEYVDPSQLSKLGLEELVGG